MNSIRSTLAIYPQRPHLPLLPQLTEQINRLLKKINCLHTLYYLAVSKDETKKIEATERGL